MSDAGRGLIAGLIAALALAILMFLVNVVGLVPRMNTVSLLTTAVSELFGTPRSIWLGWSAFFLIGVFWGLVFAWVRHRLPGRSAPVRGMVFGVWAWLVMMLVFMPVAGGGWFGLALGVGAPVVTLVGHLIFGAVLGLSWRALPAARTPGGAHR